MDFGLKNLPQSKWGSGTGRQAILKGDFAEIEAAILQSFGLQGAPALKWQDATSIKVPATPDDIAAVMLNGFPSQAHPGRFIGGGLTDGRYRENTADVTLDFDLATSLWGTEKTSQWYTPYAIAGNTDLSFTLKAMPYIRVKSQAGQVISLGTLAAPGTGIGYGFMTDELAGGKLYFLTGASKGLLRTITSNNNDNGSGGTITYGSDAVSLSQGDWVVVLPNTNFHWLGDIFNKSSGDIRKFSQEGDWVQWLEACEITVNNGPPDEFGRPTLIVTEDIRIAPPLATEVRIYGGVSLGHPDAPNTSLPAYCISTGSGTFDAIIKNCRFLGVNPDSITPFCNAYRH